MDIFIDNNLSPHLAGPLNIYLQHEEIGSAVALRDKFDSSARDEEWIDALAQENRTLRKKWCFFTADLKIRRNSAERAALMASDLSGFFLRKGLSEDQDLHLQLARIFSIIPEIQDKTARNYNPRRTSHIKYYEIPVRGKLEELIIR